MTRFMDVKELRPFKGCHPLYLTLPGREKTAGTQRVYGLRRMKTYLFGFTILVTVAMLFSACASEPATTTTTTHTQTTEVH